MGGGGGEGKKPVPEQRFVFLSSQHCYGDFKQDGGALPPHRSPACTHRSPFPRKRGGKGGGGVAQGRCIAPPRRSHPQFCRDSFWFPHRHTHTHTPHTPSPGAPCPDTVGLRQLREGLAALLGSPASIFSPPLPHSLPSLQPFCSWSIPHPPRTPRLAMGGKEKFGAGGKGRGLRYSPHPPTTFLLLTRMRGK